MGHYSPARKGGRGNRLAGLDGDLAVEDGRDGADHRVEVGQDVDAEHGCTVKLYS